MFAVIVQSPFAFNALSFYVKTVKKICDFESLYNFFQPMNGSHFL